MMSLCLVPDGGSLLLVGVGSSAHVVLPIARHRGLEVYVVTRTPEHQAHALRMGAVRAVGDCAQ